nr:choline/ethanolaminephosphotransferase 1 [Tanacetum cinerariifolium]
MGLPWWICYFMGGVKVWGVTFTCRVAEEEDRGEVTTLENELSSTKAVYHKAFVTLTKRVKKLQTQLKQKRSNAVIHSSDDEEPSLDTEDSPKQGRMIGEIDKDENVNLVSEQGEVHETVEPLKDDDDTFDAVDGKQARRTNSSSPLGELFDHGCDALACALEALAFASTAMCGRNAFWFWVISAIPFYLATWEQRTQKDTELLQTSVPLNLGADEAVHKEGVLQLRLSLLQEGVGWGSGGIAEPSPSGAWFCTNIESKSGVTCLEKFTLFLAIFEKTFLVWHGVA